MKRYRHKEVEKECSDVEIRNRWSLLVKNNDKYICRRCNKQLSRIASCGACAHHIIPVAEGGMHTNEVKHLAGLPFKTRAPNGQGGKHNKYEPCKIKAAKGKKKQCLGILPSDNQCKTMVELPARLCNRCRQRNNNI